MLYLASPYSHKDPLIMKTRFLLVEQCTAYILQRRDHVYSPIVHCHEIAAKFSLPTDFDFWQAYNRDMLRRCTEFAILDIDGWKESKGVRGEFDFAQLCEMPTKLISDLGEYRGQLFSWPA